MDEQQKQMIRTAYAKLPEVLQEAITNADVKEKLRNLAKVHKLHLDKWSVLENEIMLALLGITKPKDLPYKIQKTVDVSFETAVEITDSVAKIVFNPIQDQVHATIGESQSVVEEVDNNSLENKKISFEPKGLARGKIDISKFSPASINPNTYKPKNNTVKTLVHDPYQEPVDN
jgi:hypothetical protein